MGMGGQVRHEADHSPSSNSKAKRMWSYTSIPPSQLHGMVLDWKSFKKRLKIWQEIKRERLKEGTWTHWVSSDLNVPQKHMLIPFQLSLLK
jgi:hypothetical protein